MSAANRWSTRSTPRWATGARPAAASGTRERVSSGARVRRGRTIYRFDKDSNKPATSTCFGACAKTWEPVLAGAGIDIADPAIAQGLIGVIDRPEGKQITLNGWPLYYFKTDLKLGQTAGQGKGGTWFAISPDGKKAKQSGAGAPAGNGTYSY